MQRLGDSKGGALQGRATIALGPLLYHWQPDRFRDFYAQIADEAPVDTVCIGEVVCSRRMPFIADLIGPAIERLERGGKSVVLSTLAMPTLARERRLMRDLIADSERVIEVNDVSTLAQIKGRPFVVGPLVNVYNEATLAYLNRRGACSVCLPPELPLSSIRTLAAAAQGIGVEVFAWGRVPLAISARCYHARLHKLGKDGCQFVCVKDLDGLDIDTLDGQPFLNVNGVQTLSRSYACLIGDIPELLAAGVTGLRLSPHACDMVLVSKLFRDVVDGRSEAPAALEKLKAGLPEIPLSNGFLYGEAGVNLVGR
jgi:collagenase-like PrtC family protease